MSTMRFGQKIGLTDQLLRDICVGDLVKDAEGVEYSIDRYGRAKPLGGGNEVPVKTLKGVEVVSDLPGNTQTSPVDFDDEAAMLRAIEKGVKDAGDQRLVDELRSRGWNVTCSKLTEKIVYEEVSL